MCKIIAKLSVRRQDLVALIYRCRPFSRQARQRPLSSSADGLCFLLKADLLGEGISFNSAMVANVAKLF